jgi:hypothetical protein
MRRDIAVAGFVLTCDEWDALDARARAQLEELVARRDDGIVEYELYEISTETVTPRSP